MLPSWVVIQMRRHCRRQVFQRGALVDIIMGPLIQNWRDSTLFYQPCKIGFFLSIFGLLFQQARMVMIKFYSNETVGGEWARGDILWHQCPLTRQIWEKLWGNSEKMENYPRHVEHKFYYILSLNGDFTWLSCALLNIGRPWKKVINNCILKLNNWSWNLQQQLLTEACYCWKIWGQYLEFATLAYFPSLK